MKLVEAFLTKNPCYTAGRKITVQGLMLHSVGCPQPSAVSFVNGWNSASYDRACVHAFIDGNDGTVYQTLPWNHRGWHAGGSANNTHIGVEICEPACITYTTGALFKCSDVNAAQVVAKRTYQSAVELFAMLCKQYGLNPLADGVIIGHQEGAKRGIASNHGDPEHLWRQLGLCYTMDTFRTAVKAAMAGEAVEEKPSATPATSVNVNDLVEITGTHYCTGKAIPSWVKRKRWYIRSVSGNRVIIGKSEDGINNILSPVYAADVKVVNKRAETTEYHVHTVVRGDTLWELSKRYLGEGSRYREIKKLNNLNSNALYIGMKLKIPK